MRTGIPSFIGLCLCAALLAACASVPSHEEIQAGFNAGLKDYDAGDYKAAYETWEKIDDYDLAALRNVAIMLRKGQGVAKDPKAAQQRMELAAQSGLVTAMADLGDMLLKGEARPPDPAAAARWLERATEGGHPIAAFQLGQLYEQGSGVPKDIETARRLYQIAAAAGVKGAAERLAALPPPVPPPAAPPAPSRH